MTRPCDTVDEGPFTGAHTWAAAQNVVGPLKAWLADEHEGQVMTLVEDGSFVEYVRVLVRLYEEGRDAWAIEWYRANDASEALEYARALLGRASAWIKDDVEQAETAQESELGQSLLDDIAETFKEIEP